MNLRKIRSIIITCAIVGAMATVFFQETVHLRVYAEEYVYDSLNRVIKVIYEDGGYVEYVYDRNGNIVKTVVHTADNLDKPESGESGKDHGTNTDKESGADNESGESGKDQETSTDKESGADNESGESGKDHGANTDKESGADNESGESGKDQGTNTDKVPGADKESGESKKDKDSASNKDSVESGEDKDFQPDKESGKTQVESDKGEKTESSKKSEKSVSNKEAKLDRGLETDNDSAQIQTPAEDVENADLEINRGRRETLENGDGSVIGILFHFILYFVRIIIERV